MKSVKPIYTDKRRNRYCSKKETQTKTNDYQRKRESKQKINFLLFSLRINVSDREENELKVKQNMFHSFLLKISFQFMHQLYDSICAFSVLYGSIDLVVFFITVDGEEGDGDEATVVVVVFGDDFELLFIIRNGFTFILPSFTNVLFDSSYFMSLKLPKR